MRPTTLEREPTVLIVDDHPENLDLLSTFLEMNGYAVRASTDAREAIQSADIDPPSLILLDVNMPGISGFTACEMLKEHENTEAIPVIFISADNSAEQRLQGFKLGAVDFIAAPFVLEEIEARICSRLEVEALRQRDRDRAIAFESLLRDQIVLDRQQQHIVNLLAHDLKNPLQAIIGTLQSLQPECSVCTSTRGMQESIEIGLDACVNMSQMIEQLPAQRHSLTDALVINKHVTRFSQIVRAARAMLTDAPNVSFETETDCDIWCDKSIMSRVLVNLISNALQHGGEGTQVVVNCTADELQTVIEVVDNGEGMTETDLDSLFPPYDLNNSVCSKDYSLGLAFCRLAVDGHHGTIEVESEPKRGTKFLVQLPNNLEHQLA